jgi:hypothetical protein
MDHSPAVEARWCDQKGHKWGELEVEGLGLSGKLKLSRWCARCGLEEEHWAERSVAGTNRKAVGW